MVSKGDVAAGRVAHVIHAYQHHSLRFGRAQECSWPKPACVWHKAWPSLVCIKDRSRPTPVGFVDPCQPRRVGVLNPSRLRPVWVRGWRSNHGASSVLGPLWISMCTDIWVGWRRRAPDGTWYNTKPKFGKRNSAPTLAFGLLHQLRKKVIQLCFSSGRA